MNQKLYGKVLKNLNLYKKAEEIGFDYILNPATGELHDLTSPHKFWGSHNIQYSNLENFIGIKNLGILQIHHFKDGTEVPIFDLNTGDSLGSFVLNKCQHCFPK